MARDKSKLENALRFITGGKAPVVRGNFKAIDDDLVKGADKVLNEKDLVDSAPDVLRFAEKEIAEQGVHGKDAMIKQVYPEGSEQGVLQRVGNKITGTGRVLGDIIPSFKENSLRALGGAEQAEKVVAKHAQASTKEGGLRGAANISDNPAASFAQTIKNEVGAIDNQFTSRFNMIGDLKTKTNPNFVLEEVTKVINKYKKDKYFATGEEGKAIIGGMNKHLNDLINGQYKSQTEMLRSLRRYTGERKHVANTKNIAEKHTISALNEDVRKAFMKAVERKGQSRKKLIPILKEQRRKAYIAGDEAKVAKIEKQIEFNENFLSSAKKLDKEFSAYKSLQSKSKAGSGKLDAAEVFRALDDPLASSKLLDKILTDSIHGPQLLIKFRKQIAAIEKTSGREGLSAKVEQNLQDTLAHKLFKKDITPKDHSPTFMKFITSVDGRKMMKEVWPKSGGKGGVIDQWAYVMNRTADKEQLGSYLTRMFATYLGPAAAAGMGIAGAGAGVAVSAGAAFGTMAIIGGLLKSKQFQNFAIKQFSKDPYKPYQALGKVGDILEKAGLDNQLW